MTVAENHGEIVQLDKPFSSAPPLGATSPIGSGRFYRKEASNAKSRLCCYANVASRPLSDGRVFRIEWLVDIVNRRLLNSWRRSEPVEAAIGEYLLTT